MPIASGAAGRVDVGVDTNTTWRADGLKKRTQTLYHDSYLQRYQEQRKKNKGDLLPGAKDSTALCEQENEGAEEGSPQTDSCIEGHTSERSSCGEGTKKSLLCVLL